MEELLNMVNTELITWEYSHLHQTIQSVKENDRILNVENGDDDNNEGIKGTSSKILMIGTGGIGCELLKDLLVCGFNDIEIVDLDTIELSNLNRQFLFRQDDIGKSKAETAKKRSQKFAINAKITAHHGDIRSPKLGLSFFKKFDLIINALDNLPTRRHVNRICLALNKPLLESGTQGYSGQSYLINGGKTECYECTEKVTQKTYPVCTIRDTPSEPVHCIAWAKMMFDSLFGPDDLKNDLSDLKIIKEKDETNIIYAKRLFNFMFGESIKNRLKTIAKNDQKNKENPIPIFIETTINENIPSATTKLNDQNSVMTQIESSQNFLHTVEKIFQNDLIGKIVFDKDLEIAMDFVHHAANLRMRNFRINPVSRFKAMGIAGNIVHAIATTNAVCAGLLARDAVKILCDDDKTSCRRSWIQLNYGNGKVIQPEKLSPPNPSCFVCNKQTMNLICNIKDFSVRELFDDVLKKRLGMVSPVVDVSYGESDNFITEDISEWDGNEKWMANYFSRPLSHEHVKIRHGSILTVDDEMQKFSVNMIITHFQNFGESEIKGESEEVSRFRLIKKQDFRVDDFSATKGKKRNRMKGEDELMIQNEKMAMTKRHK